MTLVSPALVDRFFTTSTSWEATPQCSWECKLVQPLWRTVWRFLKKLKIELSYDSAFLLLGIYLDKTVTETTGDVSSIPWSGRSPGGGHGKPLQYFCLENPTDREAWQATVHGVTKSRTRLKRLSSSTSYVKMRFRS